MSEKVYTSTDVNPYEGVTLPERKGVDAAEADRLAEQAKRDGYVILPNLIDVPTMQAIKEEILPLLQYDGRNDFEGYKTRRIYSLIEKTLSCNPMVDHPMVMALLDRFLMRNYLLSQLQAINIHPGEVRQPLHHDDSIYPVARPRPPFGAATIWAVDDFTEENGATLVIPRSHEWGDVPSNEIDQAQLMPVVMPAGSAVFFVGTLWHCAGPNTTDQTRMAVTAQYCEPWARTQENFSLSISRERARKCSEEIRGMLGYSMLFPFIGFVDGRDPKRLLEE